MSIANNLLANAAQLNEDKAQDRLKGTVEKLSSGLRINSAADDPSGLAIAETLDTQVKGFDAATRSVQDGSNAATVAESALGVITAILQRIRSMSVQASSDIESASDKGDLQAEVRQLLLEINRIAENTSFNGVPLLDGSHAGFSPGQAASIRITSNTSTAGSPTLVDGDFSTPQIAHNSAVFNPPNTAWVYSANAGVYNGPNPPGFAPPVPPPVNQAAWLNSNGDSIAQTVKLDSGTQYQLTFEAGEDLGAGPNGLTVQLDGAPIFVASPPPNQQWQTFTTPPFTAAAGSHTITFLNTNGVFASMYLQHISLQQVSTPPNGGITASGSLIASAYPGNANFNTTFGGVFGFGGTGTVDGTIEVQVINTGSTIAAQETFINSATGVTCVAPNLLPPNGFADAFDNVTVALGNFTASDVGESGYVKISQYVAPSGSAQNAPLVIHDAFQEGAVLAVALPESDTQTLRLSNINLMISSAGAHSIGAEDAIGQTDYALQLLLGQRAQLGAIMVSLGEATANNNIASVNLTQSKSAVWDFNVAQGATELAKEEVVVQIGEQVIADANTNAQTVEQLFTNLGH